MANDTTSSSEPLQRLAALAGRADGEPVWPAESWEAVRQLGALGWCISKTYDGTERTGVELLDDYERLAGACLTSCFILSQRDAACRRIRDSGNQALCQELLPPLARGERFATVGISQLTTSRQHGAPALTARERGDVFILDGIMPWVTGAAHANHFVTGAMVPRDDGTYLQILAVLPADCPGVTVSPALALSALEGSITAEVRCANVVLERRWLLAGPAATVLATKGGPGGLETSCLALGLAGAAIDYLHEEARRRPDLAQGAEHLEQNRREVRQELRRLAGGGGSAEAASELRAKANTLVLRSTQAALTASKGSGFLRSHPAQRWARQALFFLVWSCPRPAAEATLAYLTPPAACDT